MHGGVAQTDEQTAIFVSVVEPLFEKEYNVRKLNKQELSLYWAMIPYDIEEPIYIVESKNQRFLLDFMKSKEDERLVVLHVDELSAYQVKR